jgi:dienelactone hydrolase
VETRDVGYRADGRSLTGWMALPEGDGVRAGVLVAHEAGGLGEHVMTSARRLAELGYVAFAVDYHGRERTHSDDELSARLEYLGTRPEVMRAIGREALGVLAGEARVDAARVAAIGYCFGANMMLELARDGADLKAVVGFHPGVADHDAASSRGIRGRVLACIGSEDPFMPAEQRAAFEEEMRSAGVDWQIHLYGGAKHSFTNPSADSYGEPAVGYHKAADERSWRAMLGLFDEVLGPVA